MERPWTISPLSAIRGRGWSRAAGWTWWMAIGRWGWRMWPGGGRMTGRTAAVRSTGGCAARWAETRTRCWGWVRASTWASFPVLFPYLAPLWCATTTTTYTRWRWVEFWRVVPITMRAWSRIAVWSTRPAWECFNYFVWDLRSCAASLSAWVPWLGHLLTS